MGIRKWLSNKMMTLGVMGLWGFGLILHVWTTILTFFSYGFEASIFAFIFPIVAEFFRFFKILITRGVSSLYCITTFICLSFFALVMLSMWLENTRADDD